MKFYGPIGREFLPKKQASDSKHSLIRVRIRVRISWIRVRQGGIYNTQLQEMLPLRTFPCTYMAMRVRTSFHLSLLSACCIQVIDPD